MTNWFIVMACPLTKTSNQQRIHTTQHPTHILMSGMYVCVCKDGNDITTSNAISIWASNLSTTYLYNISNGWLSILYFHCFGTKNNNSKRNLLLFLRFELFYHYISFRNFNDFSLTVPHFYLIHLIRNTTNENYYNYMNLVGLKNRHEECVCYFYICTYTPKILFLVYQWIYYWYQMFIGIDG